MDKLKELRKNAKKTQQDIADYLGITYQAYAHYEKGRNEPDNKTLLMLATFFNVDVNELLGYTPDSIPQRSYVEQRVKNILDKYDLNSLTEAQLNEFLTVTEITAKNIKKGN